MALTITGLSKTYPNGVRALKNLVAQHREDDVRPARAERRRQELPHAHHRDAAGSRQRIDHARRHRRPHAEERGAQDPRLPAAGVRRVSRRCPPSTCCTTSRFSRGSPRRASGKDMIEALLQQTNLWDVRKKAISTLLGRHEAALRHRAGAARESAAHHRRRAHRGPRSGRAQPLSQSPARRSGAT